MTARLALAAIAIALAALPGAAAARPVARLVADIVPGKRGSHPSPVAPVGGTRFVFTATTPADGRELWVSDGNWRHTRMVESLARGRRWPVIKHLTATNGPAFFTVCREPKDHRRCVPQTGRRLWVTDGTARGTHPVSGTKNLNATRVASTGNSQVAFWASESFNRSRIWISDGTAGGTWELAAAGQQITDDSVAPREAGGALYFVVVAPGGTRQLWRSDPRGRGAVYLTDVVFPMLDQWGSEALVLTGDVDPHVLLAGPGDPALKDLGALAGTSRGARGQIVVTPGVAYIESQNELWTVDGTSGGARQLTAPPDTLIGLLGELRSRILFFEAPTDADGISVKRVEIWVADGLGGTVTRLADLGPGSVPYFGAEADAADTVSAGLVWFRVQTPRLGGEMWSSDGTAAGTGVVRDIAPGSRGSRVGPPTAVGNVAYFSASDRGKHGQELWVARP